MEVYVYKYIYTYNTSNVWPSSYILMPVIPYWSDPSEGQKPAWTGVSRTFGLPIR